MGVFEYGELNSLIHFHALIYIPEGEMIGELVKKREYSTKRGERRTRYGNTFFDEYFGMSDFQEVNPILLKRGGTYFDYVTKYVLWDDVLDWERDIKDYGKKKRLRV